MRIVLDSYSICKVFSWVLGCRGMRCGWNPWAWGGRQHNYSSMLFTHMCAKSLHLCLTLCNPMGRSLPGSSVHGILQARTLKNFLLRGIFPIQGLDLCLLCLLHWQASSLLLTPPKKPILYIRPVLFSQNHFRIVYLSLAFLVISMVIDHGMSVSSF